MEVVLFGDAVHETVVKFVTTLGCLVVLDTMWFSSIRHVRVYEGAIDVSEVSVRYAVLARVWLAMGLCVSSTGGVMESAAWGAFVGAVVYGFFNGNEASLRVQWRRPTTMVADVAWGIVVCAFGGWFCHGVHFLLF